LAHLATSCLFSDDGLRAYVATYTDVVAVDPAGEIVWRRRVALDGVEFDCLRDGVLAGRACMDPPDDWRAFSLSASDGSDA
jgi:hypothetical protein